MSKNQILDLFLTPKEVATALGITVQGLHKICKENGIVTQPHGSRQHKIYPDQVVKLQSLRGVKKVKKRITVHSLKGGVGKTTIVHALASRASQYGFRVLMVDLDKQSNLTSTFGLRENDYKTFFDVYEDYKASKLTIKNAIVELTDFLHIIPATLKLTNLDLMLQNNVEKYDKLFERIFAPVKSSYDIIIFDLSPDIDRVTICAHCFSDLAIIPTNMDRMSIDGVELTYNHLDYIKKSLDHKINQRLILINKFDQRHSLAVDLMSFLRSEYQEDLCKKVIPVSKQIDNLLASDTCVWKEKISSCAALAGFQDVMEIILDIGSWKNQLVQSKKSNIKIPASQGHTSSRRSAHV